MDIRNENGDVLTSPDMDKGRVEERSETIHHEAIEGVEEQGHWNTIAEYDNGGKDVEWVIDVEGVEAADAWDEEVPYLLYIPYTDEELAEREAAEAAAKAAQSLADSAALALAQKLSTATTLSQVRSFSKQIAEEYADKTTSETE